METCGYVYIALVTQPDRPDTLDTITRTFANNVTISTNATYATREEGRPLSYSILEYENPTTVTTAAINNADSTTNRIVLGHVITVGLPARPVQLR